MKIGIGLYGVNGHQVFEPVADNPRARLVAAAGIPEERLGNLRETHPDIRLYPSLAEMLKDSDVQLVSLCSPVRSLQAREAIDCMRERRHVYAEKPCALSIGDLEALMSASLKYGVHFHEMAGTAFDEPYRTMGEIVRSGQLGEIVQVLVQKSYPYHGGRPQDEGVDGGQLRQAGIHALRMVEHVAGLKITEIAASETKLGNPDPKGGLHMAASFTARLRGGALASIISNYLNPQGFGHWGNEMLRIFGTKGFVESTDGGVRTRLVIGREDLGELHIAAKPVDYFDLIVGAIAGCSPLPLPMEDELHPTRAVIRAKESAEHNGVFLKV